MAISLVFLRGAADGAVENARARSTRRVNAS